MFESLQDIISITFVSGKFILLNFCGDVIVKVDQKYFRPTETDSLQGDYTKAKRMLNWMPEIDFETLIEEMIATDIYDAKADLLVKKHLDT